MLAELELFVDHYRRGNFSKTETISSILRVLGENVDVALTEQQKEATFDTYLTEILSIQSFADDSAEPRGPAQLQPTQPDLRDDGPDKRAARRSHEPDLSDDGEDGDKPAKRQKLVESEMPWYSPDEDSASGVIHPSSQETRRLLRAYNRDIPKAKFFAKIAPKSPPGIPSSQWERILRGDAIDLNQVLASLHHVIPDEERTGRLGDTEISFGVAEAKKRVWTAAE